MIVKIKNKINSILLGNKIRHQFKLLFYNYKIEKAKNKSIVIFAGIGHMYMSPFEILMYHLLRKKGYEIKYVIYNKDIPANEVITKLVNDTVGKLKFWNKSVKNAIKLLKSSNVDYDFINYNNSVFSEIKRDIPNTLNGLLTFKYDGINFGKIVEGCLYRYYKSLIFGTDVYQVAVDNLKVSLSNYIYLKSIHNSKKIDLILMSHGIYTTWEPVVEFCMMNHINYVCYDRAKTKNHINININQNSPNWDFSSAWNRYNKHSLNDIENNMVDTYLKERELQKGDVYSYNFSKKEKSIESLKSKLRIPKDKIIITVFTNLIWDAANVSRDIAFLNPLECITRTIEYFKNDSRVHIIVRSHPAEKVLETNERYSDLILDYFQNDLPINVALIKPEDSINSFSVIEMSDIGIVNTSTVGLEFAIEGKPIILISETNYRNKGFTFDVEDEVEYFKVLESQIKNITIKENQVVLARKYFFMMMFLYQKKTPLNYEKGVFYGYSYKSLEKIMNSLAIKQILNTIDRIETRDDFLIWNKIK